MVTPLVDPWDLDEYARDIHHLWKYWSTKARCATEKDDWEKAEQCSGKLAYLCDKLIALCKVRALWGNFPKWLDRAPDPIDDPLIDDATRKRLLKEDAEESRRLAVAKAEASVMKKRSRAKKTTELAILEGT